MTVSKCWILEYIWYWLVAVVLERVWCYCLWFRKEKSSSQSSSSKHRKTLKIPFISFRFVSFLFFII